MLIQGGMISSGRFAAFSVVGVYWISWIRSFWNTTLPGVTAMFLPTSKASMSVMLILSWPLPRSRSSSRFCKPFTRFSAAALDRGAQDFRIGQHEIAGRHRIDELARIEIDLARRLLVQSLDIARR